MNNTVSYQKRKNSELFEKMSLRSSLFLSDCQNYVPIYQNFFQLNETNYNSINFNNYWFLYQIGNKLDPTMNLFECKLRHTETKKVKEFPVFFKLAPLVDPLKYIIGKIDSDDPKLYSLPQISSKPEESMDRFLDVNNAAYVDSAFLFLSSHCLQQFNFIHRVEYYGSFLAIKNDFKFNIFDDLEYLANSDFFLKNKNVLFQVDNFDHIISFDEPKKKAPIKISSACSRFSVESIHNELFEDVFDDNENENEISKCDNDLEDMMNHSFQASSRHSSSLSTNSSCSSRTSYTEDEVSSVNSKDFDLEHVSFEENESKSENVLSEKNILLCGECSTPDQDTKNHEEEWEDIDDEEDEEQYEEIYATIKKFPVHVISMEDCEETFDNLIMETELTENEWFSAFMQIIMTLITYQKTFSFTHNDLHSNNVMFVPCQKKFIYYKFNNILYKVPTFGRLFKIIDFGRAIYKYKDNIFCSDSFRPGGEAASQYNCEPYFNESKPRLEPNFSFDLCRLACSLFDHVVDDMDEIKDLSKCDAVKRIIVEWCMDDKGINMLYKNNGVDRYPDFKLYKMIARCVHKHTPQNQLQRPEFKKFIYSPKKGEQINSDIINIDAMVPLFT